MRITGLSHDLLMLLNIILASVHILLSARMFGLVIGNVKLPTFVLPLFLVVSIVACILILIYSIECKDMKTIM